MPKYEKLYDFLMSKASHLTDEWYKGLDDNTSGVYASTDPEEIRLLKKQNNDFHKKFFQVFIKEETAFLEELEGWIVKVAKDENHLATPSNMILNEFYRTRNQYLDLIKQFVSLHGEEHFQEVKESWDKLIIGTMDKVTVWFLEEYDKQSMERLLSHRELINELSSPVISLTNNAGLLPLVGDIDTSRAKYILEKTIEQCAQKRLDCLYIDLSGVVMVDTMVAHEIFRLNETLRLLGVKTVLCGIRPEIAQTAIHLGLSFEQIPTFSTLERALNISLNAN
ncbi:STAS domain-containing protein [Siminovitchia fortis]|uniref:STAS domain-containing protein n=1 Tax=Siminovitchia fortis TaxID=254758 RepID=UPI0011A58757|nr:STAS domain-containing protein [Siminovitchia fortis]